jgi:hypothetical protein
LLLRRRRTDCDPTTGRRRQKWHSGYRTKRDAERALGEIISSPHAGVYVEPSKQSLAEYTADWLAAVEPTIRPATLHSYARNLRLHVLPRLGSVQLRRVDAGMLNGLYAALLADGQAVTTAAADCRPGACATSRVTDEVSRYSRPSW